MKIFLICSKNFYEKIPPIKKKLEESGHVLTMPNCYTNPETEDTYRKQGEKLHSAWKKEMILKSQKTVDENDAVLVLNFEKDGMENYIGGATFLEMYDAFKSGKKIYIYNNVPEGILKDEIVGFDPIVLGGDIYELLN